MDDLIARHEPLRDCDCHNCALRERDRLQERLARIEDAANTLLHRYRTTCGSLIETTDALEAAIAEDR